MRLWLQFRARPRAERRLIVEAVVLLGLVWIALRTLSLARGRRALDRVARRKSRAPTPPPALIAWAIGASARRIPGPRSCLREALAAEVMLRRRGYSPELHFGLRKTNSGSQLLDGHAWVTCGGNVVVGSVDNLADYAGCLISCPPG